MKAIKYLIAAALIIGAGTNAMAQGQDIKAQVATISKAIADHKDNPDAIKDQVKEFYKNYKKDPEALVGLGQAYLDVHDTASARKYAMEAIKRDKNCGDGYILLGDVEVLKDDGGNAAMWYQNAKTMDPKNPRGYIKYASIYRGRSPEEAVQSLEDLRKIMPDYPVDAEAAHFFYTARKYDQAITYYGKVATDQLNKEQLHEYALAGYFNGNNDKSLEISKIGNERYPRDAVFNRLTFYNSLANKDYATAIAYADKLFNASDSAKLIARDYVNAGHSYMGANNYAKAVEMFKNSLQLDSTDNDIHKFISDAYSANGDVDNALNEYHLYVQHKTNATADDYLALAEIYTNAANKATDAATKARYLKSADQVYADIDSKFSTYNAYATYMRATVNGMMDPDFKLGLAKPFYEKLIDIVNGHTNKGSNDNAYLKQAYYSLGAYYYTNGKKDEGDVYWHKLLEIDPDNQTAKEALGIK